MAPQPKAGRNHNDRKPSSNNSDVCFVQSLPIASAPRRLSRKTASLRSVKWPKISGLESPTSLTTSSASSKSTKQTRDRLFQALEIGNEYLGLVRRIDNPDSLDEMQLTKCFQILHACGQATDSNATLTLTRQSMDGFLDAIFNRWTSDGDEPLPQPELDFEVDAEVVAGKICVSPSSHADMASCVEEGQCNKKVSAVATYICNPPMLKTEFSLVDSLTGQPESICPVGRGDIRWVTTNWQKELKEALRSKTISKMHKHNKHLAVWQARRLVREWARGSMSMGTDVGKMGFLGSDAANMVSTGLGLGW